MHWLNRSKKKRRRPEPKKKHGRTRNLRLSPSVSRRSN